MLSGRGIGDDHLARVDADASGQTNAPLILQVVVEADEGIAHAVRRGHGSKRVVFAHDREAEDRHHRVSDVLLDDATLTLEDGPHLVVVAQHYRAERLAVQRLAEAGRVSKVGEDDGHEPARLLQGRVREQLGPAESAKPEALRILLPTVGADQHSPSVRRPRGRKGKRKRRAKRPHMANIHDPERAHRAILVALAHNRGEMDPEKLRRLLARLAVAKPQPAR